MKRIAVIPGDGVGPEVVGESLRVLEFVAAQDPRVDLHFDSFPWGSEVAAQYPDVGTRRLLVDAAAMFAVRDPRRFDVVVASNLYADILTDLGAALMGRPTRSDRSGALP